MSNPTEQEIARAFEALRCNAWRWNDETKQYHRVDEDVAVIEAALAAEKQRALAEKLIADNDLKAK